jgi:hypothetical protein
LQKKCSQHYFTYSNSIFKLAYLVECLVDRYIFSATVFARLLFVEIS